MWRSKTVCLTRTMLSFAKILVCAFLLLLLLLAESFQVLHFLIPLYQSKVGFMYKSSRFVPFQKPEPKTDAVQFGFLGVGRWHSRRGPSAGHSTKNMSIILVLIEPWLLDMLGFLKRCVLVEGMSGK